MQSELVRGAAGRIPLRVPLFDTANLLRGWKDRAVDHGEKYPNRAPVVTSVEKLLGSKLAAYGVFGRLFSTFGAQLLRQADVNKT